jgi:hypothetical protein
MTTGSFRYRSVLFVSEIDLPLLSEPPELQQNPSLIGMSALQRLYHALSLSAFLRLCGDARVLQTR